MSNSRADVTEAASTRSSTRSSGHRRIDPADPNAATRLLWENLSRPLAVRDAARSLFGLSFDVTRQLAGALVATSVEAESLLLAMPEVLRNLSITTVQTAERCQGEVRGPILWSETVSARAGTAGATDVFICLTARRAYDTPQNRVLVAALTAVRRAAADADAVARQAYDDEVLLRARVNGDEARRFLEHRTMRDVSRKRPSRRDIAKAAAGRRSQQYQPAIDVLRRNRDPIELKHLLPFIDARTAWQHWAIVTLAAQLRKRGAPLGGFRVTPSGDLRAGRLTFRHANVAGETQNPLHGILFERLLVDVPDIVSTTDIDAATDALARRAQGRIPVIVTSAADIERAADLALSALA
ncbi:MAG TPA: hypothetical protein VFN21_07065 [Acidimicrobiales bacterium]|nr:hypothetical protein [Acidimicrobiales bacterium]